ncbi:sulfite exporter TauE/SafE family protein [Antribacter sp. KLBMP9083]|uniref:Probable membrane transporter protein n=1 Tax=Antribacter soli TaxID=2910976 RepID=A0AA41U9J5_9MICO|nr:sulfite exporter TauE/SafE family protein [Antribacter soli]MCF4121682.1 sulfite exporter TauE/SafE family protein [Antribacter soli]
MDATTLVAACAAVVLGAALQRVAGMGLGMVAAPVLTVLLGPAAGVLTSNGAAIVTALLVLGALHARVDWGRVAALTPLVLLGSVLGALTVRAASAAWLDVLVGGSVLLALAATLALRRRVRVEGRPASLVTGLAAGFMNTTCGVAAPAWTAYALATRWEHRSFAATLQPLLLVANVTSLATKLLLGAVPPADIPAWWTWPVLAVAVVGGVALGSVLARVVPTRVAAALAVTVAVAGATTALVRGVMTF